MSEKVVRETGTRDGGMGGERTGAGSGLVSLAEVQDAARRLGRVTVRTPLIPVARLEPPLLVKPESLQPTGSFKLRGAYAAITASEQAARQHGVIAHSSGNHGHAVAYAAALLGVRAVVVVPRTAPKVKTEAIEYYGAELVTVEPTWPARVAATSELMARHGYVLIPPFDDRAVIAGQGTVGLEIAADCPQVGPVLVPVAADPRTVWRPLAEAVLHSPVEPRQVFQAGANYRTHVIDLAAAHHDGSDGRSVGQVRADAAAAMDARLEHPPFVFTGLPSAICGPYDDVVLPRDGEQPDWELELAAVIGRPARRVAVTEALDAVAGWVIVNDLTLREKVFRREAGPLGADWLAAKNSPTFLPAGPVLVPRSAIPDPGDLRITLRLNGQVMPGDLVLTGSPAGNGLAHGRLLRPGDLMESTIAGLGSQANHCVAEA